MLQCNGILDRVEEETTTSTRKIVAMGKNNQDIVWGIL